MGTVKIPWGGAAGGNIVIGVPGSGDGSAPVSSDTPNEGVDRYMEITFRTTRGGDARAVRVVRQAGRREYLRDSSGETLRDSNDVELKALK